MAADSVTSLNGVQPKKNSPVKPTIKAGGMEIGNSKGTGDTSSLFQSSSTQKTQGVLKSMLGIKEPLDYIAKDEFYEAPFEIKSLVPPMADVKMVQTPSTENNLDSISYAIRARQNIYLRGNTGMGKTNLVLFTAAKMASQLYEISGEDTMDETNLIGRSLPGKNGTFDWQDGKVTKSIKPVTQVPVPLLSQPAKADLLPQGTILNATDALEAQDGNNWVQVQDLKGKTGWVLAPSLSRYKTPQEKLALKDSPNGKDGFSIKPGDLLGVVAEKKVAGEKWVQVKTPVKYLDDPMKVDWKTGWVKSDDLADVVAAKYATQLFDQPQEVKQVLQPGVSLYWEERDDDKKGGNITWSRVHVPNEFNQAGEQGYVPDCAPRPEYPILEHNFIKAGTLLLDESNLILPGVKKRLNSLLDHRRLLVIDENRNEVVKRHPTSLVFLTGNPLSYSGREQESADFVRRCHVINIEDYKAGDYEQILQNLTNLDTFTKLRIIGFHMEMTENAQRGIIGKQTGPYAYGTRDIIKLGTHVNRLMPQISHKLAADTEVFDADINDVGNGMVPVTKNGPAGTLKKGETVQVVSHENHDGDEWTRVRYGNGDVGYIKGKVEKESLNQLIWKEARKIYERRIVDDKEIKGVETALGRFFELDNKPPQDDVPVIKKLDNGTYQFGDVILPINPAGGKDVPDKETANLIVNEKTPEAARRVALIAEQIYHGDDAMLVGPTASGKTSYPSYVAMLLNRNLSFFNASDQTDKTRFLGKLVQKLGGGQFDFEWQNGLFTEAIVPKAIRPTELYTEPGGQSLGEVPQGTPLYYMKQQKTVNGEKYSLVQQYSDWMDDKDQTGKNAAWVKDKDIQSDIIIIDEGNAARSGALEGANSLFDKNRRFLILEDFDGRKVFAHPTCTIFFTANPPEFGGQRYTGVNQISPAARNRFTEIWWPEVSPMPTAGDVDDSDYEERRKGEDAELNAYMQTWLKDLPNKNELSDWAVKFYREVRNLAARHDIGATRSSGDPILYTIGNLKNLASKIKGLAPDPLECMRHIGQEILAGKPEELKDLVKQAEDKGASPSDVQRARDQWVNDKVREKISSMSPEERLAYGGKVAFLTQAYHEFADDFEDETDKKTVKTLAQTVVDSTAPTAAAPDAAQPEAA